MLSRRDMIGASMGFAACGGSLALAGAALAQASSYVPGAVIGGGIDGIVRVGDNLSAAEQIIIGKDNHICGEGHATPDPVTLSDERGLKNAVVMIKDIARGKPWAKRERFDIVQEKCVFHPYIQFAPRSFELSILNKDPVLHNIHAYEIIGRARRTLFNIAQPQANQVDRHKVALTRGSIIEIDCDAHNWMSAWIVTSDHPYVAVTDSAGRFAIDDVPAGEFELVAWHPGLGSMSTRAKVASKARAAATISFGA
ncbi:MAG: hypothetical protein HY056_11320 [Proteobacteria bacterium]|nr:hypothetical protein [Pseudomonadota bacterium]